MQTSETENITDQVCIIAGELSSSSSMAAIPKAASSKLSTTSSITGLSSTIFFLSTKSPSTSLMTYSNHSPSTVPTQEASQTQGLETTALSTGAKAGVGAGVSFASILLLGAMTCCFAGWRRRSKDLKYLTWIERRGIMKGRVELAAPEVGDSRGEKAVEAGRVGTSDQEPVEIEEGGISGLNGSLLLPCHLCRLFRP